MAYVPARLASPGTEFQIEILGELKTARLQAEPLYDKSRSLLRS